MPDSGAVYCSLLLLSGSLGQPRVADKNNEEKGLSDQIAQYNK